MKKLTRMMKRYSELQMIPEGISLSLEDDQTGFVSAYNGQKLFDFDSIKELKTLLRKAPDPEIAFESMFEN